MSIPAQGFARNSLLREAIEPIGIFLIGLGIISRLLPVIHSPRGSDLAPAHLLHIETDSEVPSRFPGLIPRTRKTVPASGWQSQPHHFCTPRV